VNADLLPGIDAAFLRALGRSLLLGLAVAGASLVVGWPVGVRIALSRFNGRRVLVALLTLPLLLPAFLLAIGLSMLWPGLGGPPAVCWSFTCLGVPLVAFASLAGALGLTRGQADAARLAGGEGHLFRLTLRSVFPLAALAAVFAGVLTLADPGPGQIFGWTGAAGELLVSFAAQHDRGLATRQALAIAVMAAVVAWPLAWKLAPVVATGLLARDVARPRFQTPGPAVISMMVLVTGILSLPLGGLLRPLTTSAWPVARAWNEVHRTAADTLLYAGLAAGFAVGLAFLLAWAAGRSASRRRWVVTVALAVLAIPPALPALWLIPWSARWTVGLALGLRGLPLAILVALRAVGSMPASWADAARVHRLRPGTFFARVALPWCSRWALPAGGVAALLGTAEIGTVLLLHPPGHGNLPLAVFTIMANAPEALIAMLCLFYVGTAAAFALSIQHILRSR